MVNRLSREFANAIVDSRTYADEARLHAMLTQIRTETPVAWAEPDDFEPFWLVTRYDDVRAVSSQNALFPSGVKQTILTRNAELAQIKAMTGGSPHQSITLIQMDGRVHMRHRLLTQSWFQPSSLKRRAGKLKAIAEEFADRMAALGGKADFASEVAFLYPLRVIMDILGVPPEDEPLILNWTLQLFGSDDPDLNLTGASSAIDAQEQLRAQFESAGQLAAYMEKLRQARIADPGEDLGSLIATGLIDGEPIKPETAVAYYMIVATAGHDTTASSTACGMWALTQHPELLGKLKAQPDLIPAFVEESVRWATPVKHFLRSASEDTELGGQTIRKGQLLMLCYPSANRDEAVFERPFVFDIERNANAHMAFGYGGHICIGQHLARMEMTNFWEAVIPRLDSVEAAGPAKLAAARLAGGFKTLPIRFEMH